MLHQNQHLFGHINTNCSDSIETGSEETSSRLMNNFLFCIINQYRYPSLDIFMNVGTVLGNFFNMFWVLPLFLVAGLFFPMRKIAIPRIQKNTDIRNSVFAFGRLYHHGHPCNSPEVRIAYAETFSCLRFICRSFMGNTGFTIQFSKWPFGFRHADSRHILDENEQDHAESNSAHIYNVGRTVADQSGNAFPV